MVLFAVALVSLLPEPAARAACTPLDTLDTLAVSAGAREIVIDGGRQRIYVANAGAQSLSVIDAASLTVINEWPLRYAVRAMALDSATGRLYISYAVGNNRVWPTQLWSIDADAGAHLSGISFAWTGDSLAVNRSLRRVYLAGSYSGPNALAFERLAAIDGDVTEVLQARTSTDGLTHFSDIAVDEATGAVYAAHHYKYNEQSYVIGLDAILQTYVGGIRFSDSTSSPDMIAVDSARKRMVLTMGGGVRIADIDMLVHRDAESPDPSRIAPYVRSISLRRPLIALDETAGVVYTTTRDGQDGEPPVLSAIDVVAAREIERAQLPRGGGPNHRLAIDPTTRRIFVTNARPMGR